MRSQVNINEVLVKAWKITWKFKIILILLLAHAGGFIKGISEADSGANSLNFDRLMLEKRRIGLQNLPYLPMFFVVIAISILTQNAKSDWLVTLIISQAEKIAILAGAILTISIVLANVAKQSLNAAVLEDLGAVAGLERGWQLFKLAWPKILLLNIILFVIGWTITIILIGDG